MATWPSETSRLGGRALAEPGHHISARESHEEAIAWLDLLIATKGQHATEDEEERQRPRAANSQTGGPQV